MDLRVGLHASTAAELAAKKQLWVSMEDLHDDEAALLFAAGRQEVVVSFYAGFQHAAAAILLLLAIEKPL